MGKFHYKYFECGTANEASKLLNNEIANWTWLSKEAKANIVRSAIFVKSETKFGPVYQVTYQA